MAPSEDLRLCIDRAIPDSYQPARAATQRALREIMTNTSSGVLPGEIDALGVMLPARLAIVVSKRWDNGTALRCRFLDGSDTQQKRVREKAKVWEKYANISP